VALSHAANQPQRGTGASAGTSAQTLCFTRRRSFSLEKETAARKRAVAWESRTRNVPCQQYGKIHLFPYIMDARVRFDLKESHAGAVILMSFATGITQ